MRNSSGRDRLLARCSRKKSICSGSHNKGALLPTFIRNRVWRGQSEPCTLSTETTLSYRRPEQELLSLLPFINYSSKTLCGIPCRSASVETRRTQESSMVLRQLSVSQLLAGDAHSSRMLVKKTSKLGTESERPLKSGRPLQAPVMACSANTQSAFSQPVGSPSMVPINSTLLPRRQSLTCSSSHHPLGFHV